LPLARFRHGLEPGPVFLYISTLEFF